MSGIAMIGQRYEKIEEVDNCQPERKEWTGVSAVAEFIIDLCAELRSTRNSFAETRELGERRKFPASQSSLSQLLIEAASAGRGGEPQ
jgi:hypothetical protein